MAVGAGAADEEEDEVIACRRRISSRAKTRSVRRAKQTVSRIRNISILIVGNSERGYSETNHRGALLGNDANNPQFILATICPRAGLSDQAVSTKMRKEMRIHRLSLLFSPTLRMASTVRV